MPPSTPIYRCGRNSRICQATRYPILEPSVKAYDINYKSIKIRRVWYILNAQHIIGYHSLWSHRKNISRKSLVLYFRYFHGVPSKFTSYPLKPLLSGGVKYYNKYSIPCKDDISKLRDGGMDTLYVIFELVHYFIMILYPHFLIEWFKSRVINVLISEKQNFSLNCIPVITT